MKAKEKRRTQQIGYLIDLLDELGNNIRTITYYTETGFWKITYKNGLRPSSVHNDDLLEFLRNA